ncbi:MAG: hypothetical protein Fur007_06860 [Rhodoferax sp.]
MAMDAFWLGLGVLVALQVLRSREQVQRVRLLGSHLARFRIESLMQEVLEGYHRALDESDPERQLPVWRHLESIEQRLSEQFAQFALAFAQLPEPLTRLNRLPLGLPFITRWWPGVTLDARKLMGVHAHGIARAVAQRDVAPRERAYRITAELMLMQHTCHWYCRSKAVAHARLVTRHHTPYAQVLSQVAPDTRNAYTAVAGVAA